MEGNFCLFRITNTSYIADFRQQIIARLSLTIYDIGKPDYIIDINTALIEANSTNDKVKGLLNICITETCTFN